MKRQKIDLHPQPAYPSRDTFLPSRLPALLLFGMLVTVVGSPGCIEIFQGPIIDGDMPSPQETWDAVLPAVGSQTLYFEDGGGWVDYHLEMVVDNQDLAEFLAERSDTLLERVDRALADRDPEDLETPRGLEEIELELRQLLADAWTGTADAPTWNFVDFVLVVDDLVPYEEIDGDMG